LSEQLFVGCLNGTSTLVLHVLNVNGCVPLGAALLQAFEILIVVERKNTKITGKAEGCSEGIFDHGAHDSSFCLHQFVVVASVIWSCSAGMSWAGASPRGLNIFSAHVCKQALVCECVCVRACTHVLI